jgi:hypothetical protein
MLKNAPKAIMLKPKPKYDIPAYATFEQRKAILHRLLEAHPKFVVRGGNSQSNPYKIHYEIILAERRAQLEYYKNSVLWSPRYTPKHFKYLFLYPAICIALLMLYLRYIQLPRKMLYLRKKYGYKFPELEAKGWLDGWIDDEIEEELYRDWTLKDLEDYEKLTHDNKLSVNERASKIKQKNLHYSLQNKLGEIHKKRSELGMDSV